MIPGSITFTSHNAMETRNLALTSTFAAQGTCTGVVFATGDRTVMGHIVAMSGETKFRLTTVQREVWFFTKIISGVALFLFCIAMIVWAVWLKKTFPGFESASSAIVNSIGCLTAFVPQVNYFECNRDYQLRLSYRDYLCVSHSLLQLFLGEWPLVTSWLKTLQVLKHWDVCQFCVRIKQGHSPREIWSVFVLFLESRIIKSLTFGISERPENSSVQYRIFAGWRRCVKETLCTSMVPLCENVSASFPTGPRLSSL